jgi:hypothetical protein
MEAQYRASATVWKSSEVRAGRKLLFSVSGFIAQEIGWGAEGERGYFDRSRTPKLIM